ncbi:MAG TPA: hypothetical protein PLR88_11440 [Bacteroidales bacterium]|nr:hypothetical protein [Bacteroidales bacterium]
MAIAAMAILIIALLGYIVFLNIQLSKKNVFIESTVRRLSGFEKNRNMDEMMSFLKEIQKLSQYSSSFADKLLEGKTFNFILENVRNLKIYIHYTRDEANARKILYEGFMFADSFYKTALPVTKDKLDLTIKHNSRKLYGDYLIVICISNDVANFYSMELEKTGIKNYVFENILTETPPSLDDNSDLVYKLPHQFIKGYINHRTGEIVKNQDFDAWYNSPSFMKNIEILKTDSSFT